MKLKILLAQYNKSTVAKKLVTLKQEIFKLY